MPKPRKNESREDWMERCVPFVMKENKSNPQAVAICSSVYDRRAEGKELSEYGQCPTCGADGNMRERRINGNDICVNGHTYPSAKSLRLYTEE